jgi:hypothetical protein
LCRHACGVDCEPNDCTTLQPPGLVLCVNDSSGTSHRNCTYAVVQCGSNDGCRIHDDCYDTCATDPNPTTCRRVCDEQCIANYSISQCYDWWGGLNYQSGPNPIIISYTYPPTAGPVLAGPCP